VGAPLEIGSDFLGYRIEELIGQGGMGVVYRSYDLRLKRPVALKLIAPALAPEEGVRANFVRETELAMSLEHPNVVPVYDAGDVDGRLYLAMRLVDGRDLRSLLVAEGVLAAARALAICSQVAAALDAAHAGGLVHRDVKPSNVLLDRDEHVYLADFGLTRRLEEETADQGNGRSLGTPAYIAPEQIEGGTVDGRADVYSLGCLLFECLTGELVFPRGSHLAVTWAHLEEEPPSASERNPELPDAIDAVIARAIAKSPEDRYPNCTALIEAAEEAIDGTSAGGDGWRSPSSRSRRSVSPQLSPWPSRPAGTARRRAPIRSSERPTRSCASSRVRIRSAGSFRSRNDRWQWPQQAPASGSTATTGSTRSPGSTLRPTASRSA
jgi:serine/threonine-protein kinase